MATSIAAASKSGLHADPCEDWLALHRYRVGSILTGMLRTGLRHSHERLVIPSLVNFPNLEQPDHNAEAMNIQCPPRPRPAPDSSWTERIFHNVRMMDPRRHGRRSLACQD